MGTETSDDAAVYRLRDDLAIVQTVDYFPPIVDDPYSFGAISAANSLSDIYAMGARPLLALNIVGFPIQTLPLSTLSEILRGGSDKVKEAGALLVGGHSIDDAEPKYGLVVTGVIHPEDVVKNVGARPGDLLFLTKPLGMGIISTAIKREKVSEQTIRTAVEIMSTLNRSAAEAMLEVGVHACTDVTGFGLLGHLYGMTRGSRVGARLSLARIPILPEVFPLAESGLVPGGTQRNMAYLTDQKAVTWHPTITEIQKTVLADAQTSGGLLIAVSPEKGDALQKRLEKAKTPATAQIGEFIEDPAGRIRVEP